MGDDLDDLLVAVTGGANGLHVGVVDPTARVDDAGGELQGGARFWIGRFGVLRVTHLLGRGAGLLAEHRVRGEAVFAAVAVSDAYDNAVAGIQVGFEAAATGASATLSALSAVTGVDGTASGGATANAEPGKYDVDATAAGLDRVAFALVNRAPVLALSLGIEDGIDYVRYGENIDYVLTLQTAGTDTATGVSLHVPLPAQIDSAATLWTCLDVASGCEAEGSGPLLDSGVQIAPAGRVRWLIGTPVRSDAAGDQVQLQAAAEAIYHPQVGASDQNWLLLFRDDFDDAAAEVDAASGTAGPIAN